MRRFLVAALLLAALIGCSETKSDAPPVQQAGVAPSNPPPPAPQPSADPAPTPPPGAQPSQSPTPPPAAPARAKGGVDFAHQARLLYEVAACGVETPPPAGFDASVIEKHCALMREDMSQYRTRWLERAREFLSKVVPAGIPNTVVYPFGGGDLLTALATFPDATDITTISLEGGGDPRTIDTLRGGQLKVSLSAIRTNVQHVTTLFWAATTSLNRAANSQLPGQVVFALVALAVHGFEPVSLRYFTFEPDGALHYVTAEDIAANDSRKKKREEKQRLMVRPDLYNHFEIEYRPRGAAAGAPVRVYRHIAYDLSDGYLRRDPALLRHLESKGKVTGMTKAAANYMWRDDFSMIRDYLLANMEWMISDATGIPPSFASTAGFQQEVWGRFSGAAFTTGPAARERELAKLWRERPYREMPIRYGYHDRDKHDHLLVTARAR